jgi:hypothetical protein
MRTETKKPKKKKDNHTLYLEGERKEGKKDRRRQSNHHTWSRAPPCGRGHGGASEEMAEYQVWSLSGVTRVVIIARTPPTRLTRANRFFY